MCEKIKSEEIKKLKLFFLKCALDTCFYSSVQESFKGSFLLVWYWLQPPRYRLRVSGIDNGWNLTNVQCAKIMSCDITNCKQQITTQKCRTTQKLSELVKNKNTQFE